MLNITQEEVMQTWKKGSPDEPIISIESLAYNHELYIEQTLDGILRQKTEYAFEVIIHDDASIDDTAKIIKRYVEKFPLIIKPIFQTENQYSKPDVTFDDIMIPRLMGRYIAYCECDDYWIDELKLQKQVKFLEDNPDYGMCYTNFNMLYQKSGEMKYDLFTLHEKEFHSEFSLKYWIMHLGYTAPMTWVYKRELFDSYQPCLSCDGSFLWFAHFLASTKVKCLKDETTAVYRVLDESASHSNDIQKNIERREKLAELQKMLIDKYGFSGELKQQIDRAVLKDKIMLENEGVPYKLKKLWDFVYSKENVYIYGNGYYKEILLNYFNKKKYSIRGIVVTRKEQQEENVIEFADLFLGELDGVIIALNYENTEEVKQFLKRKIKSSQVLYPDYI